VFAGVRFRSREFPRLVVRYVPPSETVADHLHVDESLAEIDAADFPLVAINVNHVDSDWLLEDLVAKRGA
jgi:hypothetical protein